MAPTQKVANASVTKSGRTRAVTRSQGSAGLEESSSLLTTLKDQSQGRKKAPPLSGCKCSSALPATKPGTNVPVTTTNSNANSLNNAVTTIDAGTESTVLAGIVSNKVPSTYTNPVESKSTSGIVDGEALGSTSNDAKTFRDKPELVGIPLSPLKPLLSSISNRQSNAPSNGTVNIGEALDCSVKSSSVPVAASMTNFLLSSARTALVSLPRGKKRLSSQLLFNETSNVGNNRDVASSSSRKIVTPPSRVVNSTCGGAVEKSKASKSCSLQVPAPRVEVTKRHKGRDSVPYQEQQLVNNVVPDIEAPSNKPVFDLDHGNVEMCMGSDNLDNADSDVNSMYMDSHHNNDLECEDSEGVAHVQNRMKAKDLPVVHFRGGATSASNYDSRFCQPLSVYSFTNVPPNFNDMFKFPFPKALAMTATKQLFCFKFGNFVFAALNKDLCIQAMSDFPRLFAKPLPLNLPCPYGCGRSFRTSLDLMLHVEFRVTRKSCNCVSPVAAAMDKSGEEDVDHNIFLISPRHEAAFYLRKEVINMLKVTPTDPGGPVDLIDAEALPISVGSQARHHVEQMTTELNRETKHITGITLKGTRTLWSLGSFKRTWMSRSVKEGDLRTDSESTLLLPDLLLLSFLKPISL